MTMCNPQCGMRNPQRRMRNVECGIRNAECGIRTELCGTVQSAAESARGDAEFRIPQTYEPALTDPEFRKILLLKLW